MRLFVFFQLFALSVVLSACGDPRPPEKMRGTLIHAFSSNMKTFDPTRTIYSQETAIVAQVLETLVRWNNDVELEPFLAERWETPDGCHTWIFHLREGVFFHDGEPFNAKAVKAHFDRVRDPATAATRALLVQEVERVEARSEHTVVFHLDQANCIFPERLTGAFASIPSPMAVAKHGDQFGRNPVGTGPFQFKEWVPDVRIVLEKNEDYWRADRFHIDRLEFWPVPENTTRYIYLEQGIVDMADVAFAHVNVAKADDNLVFQSTPQLSIRYVGFNTQKPPFDDPRVRRAANYAVNKEDMIKYVFFGVGEPGEGPFPSLLPDFNPDIYQYEYDVEKAKSLLAEAGYEGGVDVEMWTYETGQYRLAADAVADYLRKIGIRIDMKILDNAVYWDKFDAYNTRSGEWYPQKEGVFDLFVGGWVGGEAAHGYLEPLFKVNSYSNSSFYDNARVNFLLDEYKTMPDPLDRRKVYHEIQEIVVDDAPWIFAFHGQVNIAHQQRVQGFKVNPAGRLFFDDVQLDDNTEPQVAGVQ